MRSSFIFAMGLVLVASCSVGALMASTGDVSATIREAAPDGEGVSAGTVKFVDSKYGLMIIPDLRGLAPGPHAAHVHENPSCVAGPDGAPAGGAGSHFDPKGAGVHGGPYGNGHLGDLPNLIVENDGAARVPVLAPRVKAADLKGHALIIHAGADRYDEHAMHQHGEGGSRMYCGVIR
jgi:superoxide dismutase, Cu-Zn family